MNVYTKAATADVIVNGSTTREKERSGEAPRSRAFSRRSAGTFCIADAIIRIAYGRKTLTQAITTVVRLKRRKRSGGLTTPNRIRAALTIPCSPKIVYQA